ERSGGAWRPSPGAVYPALQQLADEGLVEAEESSGRRTFSLTEAGRRHIEENPGTARAAWESMATDNSDEMPGLFAQAAQLAGSIVQMAHVGTPGQIRAAEALLEQTRRQMYQILASGEGSKQDQEQEGGTAMDERIRASDADRDHVTTRLREHFAAGRLTPDELDERISAALNAKTHGQLRALMADLPEPAPAAPKATQRPYPAAPPWVVRRRGPRF